MIRRFERSLGKLLFPRAERWRRERNTKMFLMICLVQLMLAGGVAYYIHHGAR